MLYITIKIPLTSRNTVFTVYRLHRVPIVLSSERSEKSIIKFEKPYMAVSNNEMFYIMLTHAEYEWCHGKTMRRCNQGLAMQEAENPNCALALYFNDVEQISKLCEFILFPKGNKIETHIFHIRSNTFFISTNDVNWIQTCARGTPTHIKPCKLCIISVPCGCSLKAKTFFIPATLDNCNITKVPSQVLSHNLPALIAFYGEEGTLNNLSQRVKTTLDKSIEYPDIDVIDKNFSNVLKQSENLELSLRKLLRPSKIKRKFMQMRFQN